MAFNWGALAGGILKGASFAGVPGASIGSSLLSGFSGSTMTGGGGGGGNGYAPLRRSRGMYMRKGRLFMGYSQKEVKAAMRKTYGGKR